MTLSQTSRRTLFWMIQYKELTAALSQTQMQKKPILLLKTVFNSIHNANAGPREGHAPLRLIENRHCNSKLYKCIKIQKKNIKNKRKKNTDGTTNTLEC